MLKQDFLKELRSGLFGLPQADIEERLTFYGEMIDDRVEEGLSEEEAVSAIGPVDEIIAQTVAEIPLTKLVKERVKQKRTRKGWEILLIVLGFPLWLPLLIAAAVLLCVYIVIWVLLICLWAVWGAIGGCAIGGLMVSVVYFAQGHVPTGIAALGAGLVLAALSIFLFFGCKAASKGIVKLTKRIARGIKSRIIGKESAK